MIQYSDNDYALSVFLNGKFQESKLSFSGIGGLSISASSSGLVTISGGASGGSSSDAVTVTGAQTISGIKTFANEVILSFSPVASSDATNKQYVDSLFNNAVLLSGTQTVSGAKTFSTAVTLSYTPSLSGHAVNKQYVDTLSGTIGGNLGDIGVSGSSVMHNIFGYYREVSPTTTLSASGDLTIVASTKGTWRKTGGTSTVTFQNMTEGQQINLLVESTGSAYTLSFSGETFRWINGIVPTPTISSGVYDLYTFYKVGGIVYATSAFNMF